MTKFIVRNVDSLTRLLELLALDEKCSKDLGELGIREIILVEGELIDCFLFPPLICYHLAQWIDQAIS